MNIFSIFLFSFTLSISSAYTQVVDMPQKAVKENQAHAKKLLREFANDQEFQDISERFIKNTRFSTEALNACYRSTSYLQKHKPYAEKNGFSILPKGSLGKIFGGCIRMIRNISISPLAAHVCAIANDFSTKGKSFKKLHLHTPDCLIRIRNKKIDVEKLKKCNKLNARIDAFKLRFCIAKSSNSISFDDKNDLKDTPFKYTPLFMLEDTYPIPNDETAVKVCFERDKKTRILIKEHPLTTCAKKENQCKEELAILKKAYQTVIAQKQSELDMFSQTLEEMKKSMDLIVLKESADCPNKIDDIKSEILRLKLSDNDDHRSIGKQIEKSYNHNARKTQVNKE